MYIARRVVLRVVIWILTLVNYKHARTYHGIEHSF